MINNAARGSDVLQCETINSMPVQNVATRGIVDLQCETLEDVQLTVLGTVGGGHLQGFAMLLTATRGSVRPRMACLCSLSPLEAVLSCRPMCREECQ